MAIKIAIWEHYSICKQFWANWIAKDAIEKPIIYGHKYIKDHFLFSSVRDFIETYALKYKTICKWHLVMF